MPQKTREEKREYAHWYYHTERGHERVRIAGDKYRFANLDKIREHRNLRDYGLTEEEYQILWNSQGGKCAICGKESGKALCVDHDHKTGKVRGLLCDNCNAALGHIHDDPKIAIKIIEYLK